MNTRTKHRNRTGVVFAEDVIEFVVRYKLAHDGNSPTIRQIREALGIASMTVFYDLLHELRDVGLIVVPEHGASRGIEIVGGYQNYPLSEAQ